MFTSGEYAVVQVQKDSRGSFEQMGSKEKYWYIDKNNGKSLLKIGRPDTGEDWAEKVACELARSMCLAHAEYELAEYEGKSSVVSKCILRQSDDIKEELIPGNVWLLKFVPGYPMKQSCRVSEHTFDVVIGTVKNVNQHLPINWQPVVGIESPIDLFVGYLVFDAWIGNTDRHHENWASVATPQNGGKRSISLAPTYDHAASLGRELTDTVRNNRLFTRDAGFSVEAYSAKALSEIYRNRDDSKPMTTFDVVRECRRDYRDSVDIWIDKIVGIDDEEIKEILGRVPESRMSPVSKKFAFELLKVNRERLVSMLGTSS